MNYFDLTKAPYYDKEVYHSGIQFNLLPIINKETVRQYNNEFFVKTEGDGIVDLETSGSTGKIVKVKWNVLDYNASLCFPWKKRFSFGIKPTDNYLTDHSWIRFNGSIVTPKIYVDKNHISFSKVFIDNDSLKMYTDTIKKSKPTWMMISPSFAIILGKYCNDKSISLNSLKLIELSGEYVSDDLHDLINVIFSGIPVVNQYGMVEANVIAYEKYNNVFEPLRGNKVEIIDDNKNDCLINETGRIIITNYMNSNMPLIRYDTGDYGKIISLSPFLFKIVDSRKNNYYIIGNKKYHSSVFYSVIAGYNNLHPKDTITNFHFTACKNGTIKAELNLTDGSRFVNRDYLESFFSKELCALLGHKTVVCVNLISDCSYYSFFKKNNYFCYEE